MKTVFSENARRVLEKRYLKKNVSGKCIETPDEMLHRVAHHVASADTAYGGAADVSKTEKKFYQMMAGLLFLPNSPTLMNAGQRIGQLAACFVLPVNDSMESIFDAVKHTAIIHKSGGGTGFSFSRIRPANDIVSTTSGVSSGPVSFMTVFDTATEAVKQGGTRRGANMGVLSIDHPDIEAFIAAKSNPGALTNFNLSVALTERFLEALEKETEFDLVNPRTGQSVKRVSARHMFDLIVASAWKNGEPGLLFIDRINADNPIPALGRIDATNPCGEQPLLPYESCTLGSINLARMVSTKGIMFNRLKQTVRTAVHFLDNVIDINQYPLPQIKAMSLKTRKIGLGVMGFAEMLIQLKIPYDSDDALHTADNIMAFITAEARKTSMELGRRRGNFPAYDQSVFNVPEIPHMRNATITTIAPTGTISLIAGTSSGIEPLFAVAHVRHVLENQSLAEFNPLFVKIAKKEGFHSSDLMQKIAETGTLEAFNEVPAHVKQIFRTAHDICPQWHVKMQAAFQKHTDNAVSKTVNFPSNVTIDQVAQAFSLAARTGCKGVTIYRYGSREHQVLSLGNHGETPRIAPRPRPERTYGITERISTGCGKLYVTINSDEKGICEVFAQMGKTGGCASSQIEAAGRLISLALRSGVKVDAIIKQLNGIRCPSPIWQNSKMVLSCPDAMAKVLQYVTLTPDMDTITPMAGACPECGSGLVHEEGCLNCHLCGYSKCS